MIVLERIREGDWKAVDRMREILERLVPDTGGITTNERSGVATLTWAANAGSGVVSVPHGLGRRPSTVIATANADAGIAAVVWTGTITDTDFLLAGRTADGTAATGTSSVSWEAKG